MPASPPTAPRHQHLIVTVFGLYRDLRGAIPIAALIRMLGELGVEPAGVRSSVARLKKREILVSATTDGAAAYALAPQLNEVFDEGDRRIFGRHAEASDEWLLATFTVPESQRHLRHRIRMVLGRWGFGSVAPGLWIAPAGVADAVRTRLAREQLDRYVEFFTAHYTDTAALKTKVASWWDLDSLEGQYLSFVNRHSAQADRPTSTPGEAFAGYIPLVTEWRQLPYLDPGLPADLLPTGWHGRVAESLFMRLHQRWSGPSRDHARALLTG
ncbi:PaaX family transcriptional regulator [Nakamurella lactea]|uniref:PaaX family transcriptional regulator n=1 Tax=Nakamurella lactea TaxID=459515 RepID=UPI00048E934B|nr:PaaX family transcriptional regulator C-terminal domain-containing protein [Nakamurella lactea]